MKVVCTGLPRDTKMFTVGKTYTGTPNENGFNACMIKDDLNLDRYVSEACHHYHGFLIFAMGDHGVAKFVTEEVANHAENIYNDMVKYNDKTYNDLVDKVADARLSLDIIKKHRQKYDPVIVAYIVAAEKRMKV